MNLHGLEKTGILFRALCDHDLAHFLAMRYLWVVDTPNEECNKRNDETGLAEICKQMSPVCHKTTYSNVIVLLRRMENIPYPL